MFITPEQHFDLRQATSDGQYADIQKYALAANASENNPLLSGSIGVYNGVVMHETSRMFTGAGASGTANTIGRAVLCGAQAAVMGFGRGYTQNRMVGGEEMFDNGNQLGVSTGCICGLKKTRYNSKDFATMVVSSSHSDAARNASQR